MTLQKTIISQSRSLALKATKVFEPIEVGSNKLAHKVAFAPCTRYRALEDHTPSDLQLEYYEQRSKYPGTLLVTEGTLPSKKTGVQARVPGIFSQSHIDAWKKITDKVHENGSFISVQLWGLGRSADPAQNKKEGIPLKGVSKIYADGGKAAEAAGVELEEFTTEEVEDLVKEYVQAGKNAVAAGFDYVELHGATGYLLQQFLEAASNKRTDKYGGSVENRARFILEVIDGLSEAIGAEKVAIRFSPWLKFNGMEGDNGEVHPVLSFGYVIDQLQRRADAGKQIAYISFVEPRVDEMSFNESPTNSNDFANAIWKGPIIRSGSYTYDAPEWKQVLDHVQDDRTIVAFGRYFVSNPDLVSRLHDGEDLNAYDRASFFANSNWGYNTYPRFGETKEVDEEAEKARLPAPIA